MHSAEEGIHIKQMDTFSRWQINQMTHSEKDDILKKIIHSAADYMLNRGRYSQQGFTY